MQSIALARRVLRAEGLPMFLLLCLRRAQLHVRVALYKARVRCGLVPSASPVSFITANVEREMLVALEAIWRLARDRSIRAVVPDFVKPAFGRIASCGQHRIEVISYSELVRKHETPFDAIALYNGLLCRLPLELLEYVLDEWSMAHDAGGPEGGKVAVLANTDLASTAPATNSNARTRFRQIVQTLKKLEAAHLVADTPFGAKMRCHYSDMDLNIIHDVWREYLGWGLKPAGGDVIVDVGANIGAFAVACGMLCPTARIYAFEPCPDNFRLLEENIARNCPGRIHAGPLAVHRDRSPRTLFLNPDHSGGHSLYGTGEPIAVGCISLAEIIAEVGNIDLLKIDAEGSEYEILFSAPDLLRFHVRTIVMQTHRCGRWTARDMVRYLRDLGFAVETKGTDPHQMLLLARAPATLQLSIETARHHRARQLRAAA